MIESLVKDRKRGNNMKYKAIIFDMDGTLVDTAAIWDMSNKAFLESKNLYSQELYEAMTHELHGLNIRKGVSIIKALCKLHHIPDQIIIQEFQALAKKYYELEIKYIKECENFIKKLLIHNIPIAIATNADDYGLEKVNKVLNLSQYFKENMYSISSVNHVCKPSPDIFLHAAKQLKTDPQNCIAFEDSAHGIIASKTAGMYTIGINTSKKKEMLVKADKIIDCYSEINLEDYFSLLHKK